MTAGAIAPYPCRDMVFGRMRPKLSPSLDPGEFNAWYWLKAELQAFCAEHGLPVSGAKEDVQRRVRQFLAGVISRVDASVSA